METHLKTDVFFIEDKERVEVVYVRNISLSTSNAKTEKAAGNTKIICYADVDILTVKISLYVA